MAPSKLSSPHSNSTWTAKQNRLFEYALATYDRETPDCWRCRDEDEEDDDEGAGQGGSTARIEVERGSLSQERRSAGAQRSYESGGDRGASLRTPSEGFNPSESDLIPLNLILVQTKQGTTVQSSPVLPNPVKQTDPECVDNTTQYRKLVGMG
ncbi:hypothetical protein DVH24_011538 [Malus domestica]|uniref:Uncharacterized protein n=1 Tax=Malus domestica TaxID=3750 RepID=A0A498JYX2_MALDO|nr:hypothetical protein DVH24_011538 [Malus domestica]